MFITPPLLLDNDSTLLSFSSLLFSSYFMFFTLSMVILHSFLPFFQFPFHSFLPFIPTCNI